MKQTNQEITKVVAIGSLCDCEKRMHIIQISKRYRAANCDAMSDPAVLLGYSQTFGWKTAQSLVTLYYKHYKVKRLESYTSV